MPAPVVSARERVARAIFCTSRPGHVWDQQPQEVLDYWSTLADAAILAGCLAPAPVVPAAEPVPATPAVLVCGRRFYPHFEDLGGDAVVCARPLGHEGTHAVLRPLEQA